MELLETGHGPEFLNWQRPVSLIDHQRSIFQSSTGEGLDCELVVIQVEILEFGELEDDLWENRKVV